MKKSILLLSCAVGLQAFAATSINPGTTYYMRNVSNGKYLTTGGWWGTHAMSGEAAVPLEFESADAANQYRIKGTSGYFMGPDTYVDKTFDESCVWNVEALDGGKFLVKYGDDMALGLEGDYVKAIGLNASDAAQHWEILSREEMLKGLESATVEHTLNATFLLPGATIVNNSSDNAKWVFTPAGDGAQFEYAQVTDPDNENWRKTLVCRAYNNADNGASTAYTIVNTAEGLPAGAYILSGFVASDGAQPDMTVNGVNVSYTKVGDNGALTPLQFGAAMFSNKYVVKAPVTVTDGRIEIKFVKGENTNATTLYFGNFTLLYAGNNGGDVYDALYPNVKAAMDDAEAIARSLNLASFDNSAVAQRWANHSISGDGEDEVHMTYEALAAAVKAQTGSTADLTYAILNPSFELGAWGWTFNSYGDTGVAANAEGKTTEGGHGKYLYNTWFDGGKGSTVSQVITGLPAGKYVATALISAPADKTIYLFANDAHNGVTVPSDSNEGTFRSVELSFELTEPTDVTIGVAGGDDEGNFIADNGTWFRADNLTLARTGTAGVDFTTADFDETLPMEYFNLQGMRIAHPAAGQIYIVKQGDVVRKVRM